MTLEECLYLGLIGSFVFVALVIIATRWYEDIWKE